MDIVGWWNPRAAEGALRKLCADARAVQERAAGRLSALRGVAELPAVNDAHVVRDAGLAWVPATTGTVVFVVGDLHGDLASLASIEKLVAAESGADGAGPIVVFVGDFIDRGPEVHQMAVLLSVLHRLVERPDRTVLLRGNHEIWKLTGQGWPMSTCNDSLRSFLFFWQEYLPKDLLVELHETLASLSRAAIIGRSVLVSHAAIPRPRPTPEDEGGYGWIGRLGDLVGDDVAQDLAWGDPEDKPDVLNTGESRFAFARRQWDAFRGRTGLKLLLRGHEVPPDGFQWALRGDDEGAAEGVLTLNSTGGPGAFWAYREVRPVVARLRFGTKEVELAVLDLEGNELDVSTLT